jgi:hypothetical protein
MTGGIRLFLVPSQMTESLSLHIVPEFLFYSRYRFLKEGSTR